MTVQAGGLFVSKPSELDFDDLLKGFNEPHYLPVVGFDSVDFAQSFAGLESDCLKVENGLGSPDADVEDACAFSPPANFYTASLGPEKMFPTSSSITKAPSAAVCTTPLAITTGDYYDAAGGLPATSGPSIVTGEPRMATRLRTGVQSRRVIPTADSLSGSSTSSPRYDDDEESERANLADLPEMKFKKGKRKKEVDLNAIDDPEERRKQRRLAKNRATAALSRQRKRDQMAMLIERVKNQEAQISGLKQELKRANELLRSRGEPISYASGVGGGTESQPSAPGRGPAVPSGADSLLLGADALLPILSEPLEDYLIIESDGSLQ